MRGDVVERLQHARASARLPSRRARSRLPRRRASRSSPSALRRRAAVARRRRWAWRFFGRPRRTSPASADLRRQSRRTVVAVGRVEIDDVAQQHLAFDRARRASRSARAWSAGFRRCRRSSSRGRPRCAWRWRSRPRATTARPSPSRADTCAPGRRCGRYPRRRDCRSRAARRRRPRRRSAAVLGLLALDDIDAQLGEHRHRVLDLLGGHLLGRQRRVQLVIGDVAALLAARDHLLDRRRERVEERRFRRVFPRLGHFRRVRRFARHLDPALPSLTKRARVPRPRDRGGHAPRRLLFLSSTGPCVVPRSLQTDYPARGAVVPALPIEQRSLQPHSVLASTASGPEPCGRGGASPARRQGQEGSCV